MDKDVEARNNTTETGADLIMPLPLTEQEIDQLQNADFTTEFPSGARSGGFLPDIGVRPNRPNVNVTVIPIIPGVTPVSFVRFLNANPSVGPVDIYVNGRLVASSLNYRSFTEYMKTLPGFYRVAVFRAGTRRNPLVTTRMNISARRIYTMALTGTQAQSTLEMITDERRNLNPNRSYVRFVQLSPNAPLMDVYVDDRLIITDLAYEEVSRYLALNPGRHNIKLKESSTNKVILEDPNMTVKGGRSYTVYIVGNVNERPGLQVLIPLEGTSYLTF